jgi:hypothetical protein
MSGGMEKTRSWPGHPRRQARLTAAVSPHPGAPSAPRAAAVAGELAAVEQLIYHWRLSRREYGRGVQHALMWAHYATATPPSLAPPVSPANG